MNPIGLDLRNITEGRTGGMTQLVRGVCRQLFLRRPEQKFIVFSTIFNRGVLDPLPSNVEKVTLPLDTYLIELNAQALARECAVLIRSYPTAPTALPIIRYPYHKQIVLIPDIQHEHLPEFFSKPDLENRRAAFSLALSHAGAIGTISEYARGTLQARPEAHCQDIFLMYPALQEEHREESELTEEEQKLVPTGDYFVFPANLWAHKNHRRLFEAFALYQKVSPKPATLVCTGHPDGWEACRKGFEHLPIVHLGYIRPALLKHLLKQARALTYFSLYEGFGLPLLEAFATGTPVLCSNTTSLPEVGGDAVLTCAPTDSGEMCKLMLRITQEPNLREQMRVQGYARLRAFSWNDAAQNLYAACQRVAAPAPVELSQLEFSSAPPLVSIVTPSYNQGRFLKRTIESVLTQSYPHIEYFVMDGGSTDESVEILKSYGTQFTWVSEKDAGQTNAINKGLRQAKGSLLAYLNSDDVYAPDAVAHIVDRHVRQPDADMIYGMGEYIDENDKYLGEYKNELYRFERLLTECIICQPATFWTKRISDKIGLFNEKRQFAMDYDYWFRIVRAGGKVSFVPKPIGCTRWYQDTKTVSARKKINREIVDVCLESAGYVSLGHVYAMWHHLIFTEPSGWPRKLEAWPGSDNQISRLHWIWLNHGPFAFAQQAWLSGFENFKLQARQTMSTFKQSLKKSVRRFFPAPAPAPAPAQILQPRLFPRPVLQGVYPDNGLAPVCEIALPQSLQQPPRLLGYAPLENEVTLLVEGQVLGSQKLLPDETVLLDIPATAAGRLQLRFAQHTKDKYGRPWAFQLLETNLFSEPDFARVA